MISFIIGKLRLSSFLENWKRSYLNSARHENLHFKKFIMVFFDSYLNMKHLYHLLHKVTGFLGITWLWISYPPISRILPIFLRGAGNHKISLKILTWKIFIKVNTVYSSYWNNKYTCSSYIPLGFFNVNMSHERFLIVSKWDFITQEYYCTLSLCRFLFSLMFSGGVFRTLFRTFLNLLLAC